MVQLSIFHFSMSQNSIREKKPNTLNYPNSIRKILAMFQKFSMFFENIAKSKNLCFLLNIKLDSSRCLDFFKDSWKFLQKLIKYILTNNHNFTDTIWIVQGVWFFSRILFGYLDHMDRLIGRLIVFPDQTIWIART